MLTTVSSLSVIKSCVCFNDPHHAYKTLAFRQEKENTKNFTKMYGPNDAH